MVFNLMIKVLVKHFVLEIVFVLVILVVIVILGLVILVVVVKLLPSLENMKIYDKQN